MSSSWSALHAQLSRSVHRHSALATFSTLLPQNDRIGRFREPTKLLGWLHSRGSDPDSKNKMLSRLLQKACGDPSGSDLAVELLLLALWPGLCTLRHRLRDLAPVSALDADLVSQLTIGIRSARPERIRRVAATLLRNLERDLRRAYLHDANTRYSTCDCEGLDAVDANEQMDRPEVIAAAAASAFGKDGVLLTTVHIAGFSQKEAATLLGISHDAARKRCQRAMRRLTEFDGA
ncbi:hypothetical protein [uncultured Roseovarius sp.]|uniref:hypothetical protein n=1 Tax=uncultured Roseovarius sp. TaxID=293344 RepID=UPI00263207A3|nr:hypothetical protein [uncultured Roseovarius sp.]